MLQPKTYPELLGKALMLDAEPILTMMEDDNPWVEGLFMVTCVGALLGGAHLVGGLLTTASLPPLEAVRETALASLQGALATTGSGATQVDALLRGLWGWAARIGGLAGGLDRLYFALWEPVWLMLQWLILGSVIHAAARGLGGRGTWVQTLGVTALTTAPHLLGLLTVIPFVAVSGLLTTVWSLLIAYRAVELTHDLSWQRAALAVAACAPTARCPKVRPAASTGFGTRACRPTCARSRARGSCCWARRRTRAAGTRAAGSRTCRWSAPSSAS